MIGVRSCQHIANGPAAFVERGVTGRARRPHAEFRRISSLAAGADRQSAKSPQRMGARLHLLLPGVDCESTFRHPLRGGRCANTSRAHRSSTPWSTFAGHSGRPGTRAASRAPLQCSTCRLERERPSARIGTADIVHYARTHGTEV